MSKKEKVKVIIDSRLLFKIDFSDCDYTNFTNKFINPFNTSIKNCVNGGDVIKIINDTLIDNGEVIINISIPFELHNVSNCIRAYMEHLLMVYKVPYTRLVVNLKGEHINKDKIEKCEPLNGISNYVYEYDQPSYTFNIIHNNVTLLGVFE